MIVGKWAIWACGFFGSERVPASIRELAIIERQHERERVKQHAYPLVVNSQRVRWVGTQLDGFVSDFHGWGVEYLPLALDPYTFKPRVWIRTFDPDGGQVELRCKSLAREGDTIIVEILAVVDLEEDPAGWRFGPSL